MIDKDDSITRILFQNLNGLELNSHGHTLELICDSIRHHLIDSSYLCKNNTHWKHNPDLKNQNKL